MESKTITVCVIVGILGLAAAIAGFAAEATKVKKSQGRVVDDGYERYCEYPSSPAMGFAIGATVALVLARAIITSASGGCCSCCQTIPNLPAFARVCVVISWITTSVAVILFIAGAKLSTQKSLEMEVNGVYYCYTIRPGVFVGAGVMGLVGVLLAIAYYLFYVSAKNGTAKASGVERELEAPPVTDVKKPPVASRKH
ncbi:hypothetical protein L2E82_50304 [Cichorium intybus]|nr:hypothetical protein L2E82_50304 [Cichorium intybus]